MLDLEVVFGAVAAIVSNDYLIGAFLGKLIAISVLDLGIIEELIMPCLSSVVVILLTIFDLL